MKKSIMRVIETVLMMTLVVSVFYMKESSQSEKMEIPVTQVLSYAASVTPTPTPLESYRIQRGQAYQEDMSVLADLAANGDETVQEYMLSAIARHEMETAVEGVLAANGFADAVCAVRQGAVTICVQEKLDSQRAQSILEICEKMTGECAENVFLLDECRYSW